MEADGRLTHPFVTALRDALARKGLTRYQAMELAGNSRNAVDLWVREPDTRVSRKHLQALADVLDAPALLTTRPITDAARVHMTCRICDRTRTFYPGRLRNEIRRSETGGAYSGRRRATVDWQRGTGEYICNNCVRRKVYQRRKQKWAQTGQGRRRLYVIPRAQVKPSSKLLEKGRVSRLGAKNSPEHCRRIGRKSVTPTQAVEFSICWACGKMLLTKNQELPRKLNWSRSCLREWRTKNPDSLLRHPAHRLPSPSDLAVSVELAVRHDLQHEPIGTRNVRECDHRDRCGCNLATRFNLTERGIYQRIDTLIDQYLPPDDRHGPRMDRLACNLREGRNIRRRERAVKERERLAWTSVQGSRST